MSPSHASMQSVVDRVRRDLNAGNVLPIEDYLAEAGENASSILPDLVAMQLSHRLRHGENTSAREYVSRFPDCDPETILRWIGVEYRALRESGADLSEESFRQSYPEWADHPQWNSFVNAQDAVTRDADPHSTLSRNPEAKLAKSLEEVTRWLHSFLDPSPHEDDLGLFGDYRIQGILGKGGMGVVLKAFEQKLHRPVALKLILPQAAAKEGAVERFFREARAAAGILHQRIVPIFAVGEVKGIPYLAMPLLKGQSLGNLLKKRKKLPLMEALRITREAAEGLAIAHGEGLTHRDIKPDNIWLEETPEGQHVRLLDFGLARGGSAEPITIEGGIVGTPNYMAPEQAEGHAPDPKADLFSLGCVLYEMLAGRRPFEGVGVIAVLNKLASEDPPSLYSVDDSIPEKVSHLVDQLLVKDPDKRMGSATELANSIRSFQTTTIMPPTTEWHVRDVSTPEIKLPSPSRRFLTIPLLGLLIVILIVVFSRELKDPNDTGIPSDPPRVEAFRIHHFAKINAKQAEEKGPIIGSASFEAKFGDQLEFDVSFSRPVHAYLIALRPDGVMELIYPDSPDTPPTSNDRLRYPKPGRLKNVRYGLTDGIGLWSFAVAASDAPLPAFSSWAEKEPPFWGKHPGTRSSALYFDGEWIDTLSASGKLRAKDEPALDDSNPFTRALRGLKQKSKTTLTAGWAFVTEK